MITIRVLTPDETYGCNHCKNPATHEFKVTDPVHLCDRCLGIILHGLADVYLYNNEEAANE